MPTCAIYARVSTDLQGDSVNHQISYLREWARHRGSDWLAPEEFIYRDDGISGGSILKRPAIKRLLRDAKMGMFDVVMFKGISRFSRNEIDAKHMIHVLKGINIRVLSAEENYDSHNPSADLIFGIHSVIAQHEAEKIAIRTKIGHEEIAKKGQWVKGKIPYGYQVDKITRKLTPHPEEAEYVQLIFQMYTSGTQGMRAIALYLNEHGVKRRNSVKPWERVEVQRVLSNPVYTGTMRYGVHKTEIKYDEENPIVHKKKLVKNLDSDSIIVVENAHEAIIDVDAFNRAQMIANSRRINRREKSGGHLLAGLVHCPKCGKTLVFVHSSRGGRLGSYVCSNRHRFSKAVCDYPHVDAEKIESHIVSRLKKKLMSFNYEAVRDRINTEYKSVNTTTRELATKQLDDIQRQLIHANKLHLDGVYDDQTHRSIVRALQTDKTRLEDELRTLTDDSQVVEHNLQELDQFNHYVQQFRSLESVTPDNREYAHSILVRLIDRIDIVNGRFDITYKFSF